ncbi:MAG: N-6 DNA methylase [Gemmatimonadaceae bacterium]
MRAAAALLSSSRSLESLAAVVRAAVPFDDLGAIDRATHDALGLGGVGELDGWKRAELAAAMGCVRVLVLQLGTDESIREALQRLARRFTSRAPHVLWLVAAIDRSGANAGIVAWSFETQAARVASFLWEPDRVFDSDAETLCALAAIRADEDELFHARCIEVLGRDALTRRFYRALEAQVSGLAGTLSARVGTEAAREVALLYASRLLFLRFLEAKGWLDGDRGFIATRFDTCMARGGEFHRRVLLPLFFGTLNTPPAKRAGAASAFGRIPFLNGGLFARTPLERRVGLFRFPDDRLGLLLDELFQRFRFVAREDSATWSEASVDPEMLGRAFESLMAAGERRMSGVYYTPHDLVSRVGEQALSTVLQSPTLHAVRDLRVLDPACGSGAFLVYVLERLADVRRKLGECGSTSGIRRDVLARSIFGVDRNPTAVWLCELRLWLSVVIESEEQDPQRVSPLPNLDRNIRVGDAIAGAAFAQDARAIAGSARMTELRRRYIRATGTRKQSLARALDREERGRVLTLTDREIDATRYARAERLAVQRARDLFGFRSPPSPEARRELKHLRERLRALRSERRRIVDGGALPFSFGAVFADAQAAGGFDVIVGNPPWVRLHRIPAALRLQLKQRYEVYRFAPWAAGAAGAHASSGFASQIDLAALFAERSVALLRGGGALALLLPVKLWRSLAGGGLRQFLTRRTRVIRLEDLSESKHAFDAAVYPSLLVARAGESTDREVTLAVHDRAARREWTVAPVNLAYDESPGAPWMMLTPEARDAFDRVRDAGTPLSGSPFGAPRLGVKSGCNAAFVVRIADTTRELATVVDADGERGTVELRLLRPALRGDAVAPWGIAGGGGDWILWTHDVRGAPLARLPERARAWLQRRYGDLSARSDAGHARRWWSLFRVDAADSRATRVVWADFGRRPRALVLPAGDPAVPLNTCYVVRCADECDAWALAALLNSRLASAWLNAVAEPARGGYRRYLGWTVGLLPLPTDWTRARRILAAARRADDDRLLDAALAAYRLQHSDVAALLEWRR